MPNPIDIITKPLQIAAQVASGAVREIQKLTGGGEPVEPPRPTPRPEPQPPRRPAEPKALDDVTITRKVESVLFRVDSVDKGKINVNTADGVVSLRGQAKNPAMIKTLEAMAREIPEVKDVENLLHLPKTPARASNRRPTSRRERAPKRTTAERPPAAPLGTTDDGAA